MPDGYTGTIEDFNNAQQKVLSVRADVDAILKSVMDQVAGLEGQWAGSAAMAFNNMMQRFQMDQKALNDALEAISEQLGAAGATYATQEETKQSAFGNLSAQLEG